MIERGPVTAAQLGGTLRKSVVAAQRLGAVHAWLPASATPLMAPSTRVSEVLATTCAEAEAHAALLVQLSLEHADAVAVFISRRSPFLPHSVGRTAIEHALRAMHFLDPTVDERERAARRMNEWLYAIKETRRRRVGIVNAGHPGAELMPDEAPMRERIFARAETLGLLVNRTQDGGYVGALRRVSTMKLAEQYLSAPGGGGVSSAALRLHAGMTHGVETALLSTSEHGELGGRRLATPKSMEPSVLAFHLWACSSRRSTPSAASPSATTGIWKDERQTCLRRTRQEPWTHGSVRSGSTSMWSPQIANAVASSRSGQQGCGRPPVDDCGSRMIVACQGRRAKGSVSGTAVARPPLTCRPRDSCPVEPAR